eukprot:5475529-Amphidinium_carterae.1
MADAHYQLAFALRMHRPLTCTLAACAHKAGPTAPPCGVASDALGVHALTCPIGGGLVRRHNLTASVLGRAVQDNLGVIPLYEQHIPGHADGLRSDVYWHTAAGSRAVDIGITLATTPTSLHRHGAARTDGQAAKALEEHKRRHYQGALQPMIFEAHGRPGLYTRSIVRGVVSQLAAAERSAKAASLWQELSVTIQIGNAMMLEAAGLAA